MYVVIVIGGQWERAESMGRNNGHSGKEGVLIGFKLIACGLIGCRLIDKGILIGICYIILVGWIDRMYID